MISSKITNDHLYNNNEYMSVIRLFSISTGVYMNYLYATLCVNYVSFEITCIHVIVV